MLAMPAGLPSELLERRPDLRAAEQALVAANARIGQARAAYYPSISLTGILGVESTSLGDLFRTSSRYWTLGANAAQTVFDAGRTGSQVEAAQAREQQALAQYQSSIQRAFKDALDAMSAQRTTDDRVKAQDTQVKALSETMRLAKLRYDAGYSTYLEFLDAESSLYSSQLALITAERDRLIASLTLYKALGGGWMDPAVKKKAAPAPEAKPAETPAATPESAPVPAPEPKA